MPNLRVVRLAALLVVAAFSACTSAPSGGDLASADASAPPPPPPRGTLRVEAPADLRTGEAGGRATFTVALGTAPTSTVTVPIVSEDEAEIRVEPSALTFTTSDWSTPRAVTLTGQDDAVADGDRRVTLRLGPAASADGAYNGVTAPPLHATNTDDDTPGFVVAAPPPSARTNEAGGSVTFTVRLRSRPVADVTIPVSSSAPSEGAVDRSSITLTPATWDQPVTVTVTGQDDAVADGDKAFSVVLGAAQSSDPAYVARDPDDVALVNEDDDVPGLFVSSPSSSATTTEAGGASTFTVRLRSKPSADVTVALASSKPGEGQPSVTSLVFTPLDYATPRTVTVTGEDDAVDDGDQPYVVAVGPLTSADALYAAVAKVDVALTNTDDDVAGVIVSALAPSNVTTEAGGQVTFTVRLASAPTADVTIPVSSSKALEGVASPASLVFTAVSWATPQIVTVTGQDDALDDGDQAYSVVLGPPTSGDAKYAALDPPDPALLNVDDDAAGITVSAASPASQTTEAGGQITFSVVLSSQPTADVTIPVSSTEPGEGAPGAVQLVFTPANWSTPQVVTVTGQDEAVDDGDRAYSIVLGAATSVDAKYAGANPADVALTNVDDDTANVVVSALVPAGGTTEAGGTASFSVVLASQPSANVTIPISSTVPSEGVPDVAQLVFTPATWSAPQTVTVTGQADAVVDGDQPYAITLGAATSADAKYAGMNPPDVALVNRSVCYAVKTTSASARVAMPSTGWGLGTGDWTLELWVKPHADYTTGGGGKVIYMNEGYAAHNVQTALDGTGRFYCGTYHDYCPCSKGSGNLTLYSQPLTSGAWHHVACVRTGGTGRLWVDGALADTDVVDVNLSTNSGLSLGKPSGYGGYEAAPVVVGPWRFSSAARYTAAFTPAKGWAVDASTVSQFLVSGGLVGATITDEAGGDNNGTVTGGVVAANAESPCAL